jgi:hypothetical protein
VHPLGNLKVEGEEQIGVSCVKQSITEALCVIAENTNEEGAIVLGRFRKRRNRRSATTRRPTNMKIW